MWHFRHGKSWSMREIWVEDCWYQLVLVPSHSPILFASKQYLGSRIAGCLEHKASIPPPKKSMPSLFYIFLNFFQHILSNFWQIKFWIWQALYMFLGNVCNPSFLVYFSHYSHHVFLEQKLLHLLMSHDELCWNEDIIFRIYFLKKYDLQSWKIIDFWNFDFSLGDIKSCSPAPFI